MVPRACESGLEGSLRPGLDLAKSSGCTNCHATDTKKVGPSFKDIAQKYKGKADAEATLTKEVSEGKGHPAITSPRPT